MAYDGQRAIDLFRESRPDVLLIDIRMEKNERPNRGRTDLAGVSHC